MPQRLSISYSSGKTATPSILKKSSKQNVMHFICVIFPMVRIGFEVNSLKRKSIVNIILGWDNFSIFNAI